MQLDGDGPCLCVQLSVALVHARLNIGATRGSKGTLGPPHCSCVSATLRLRPWRWGRSLSERTFARHWLKRTAALDSKEKNKIKKLPDKWPGFLVKSYADFF